MGNVLGASRDKCQEEWHSPKRSRSINKNSQKL